MNKKTVFITCGVLAAVFAALLLVVVGLVAVSFQGVSSRQPTPAEKQLLVSIDALSDYADIPGQRNLCESYLAKTNLDGSLELEYAYDTDDDPNAEDFLFFKSEAEPADDEASAREFFQDSIKAYEIGFTLVPGRELKEDPDLFQLGDENHAGIIMQDGSPVGTLVVSRNGNVVHSLLIIGVYFDDRESLESLLAPAMK